MSDAALALEVSMSSGDDRVLSSVDVTGSFFLARPDASLQAIVTPAKATVTAMAQPAVAALGTIDLKTIRVKLALFTQGRPGAIDLPAGASISPALVWVIFIPRVSDPTGGSSHGVPAPGVTRTTSVRSNVVDVVSFVGALKGAAQGTYVIG